MKDFLNSNCKNWFLHIKSWKSTLENEISKKGILQIDFQIEFWKWNMKTWSRNIVSKQKSIVFEQNWSVNQFCSILYTINILVTFVALSVPYIQIYTDTNIHACIHTSIHTIANTPYMAYYSWWKTFAIPCTLPLFLKSICGYQLLQAFIAYTRAKIDTRAKICQKTFVVTK